MLKYVACLALFLGSAMPVKAGELDDERPAQTTPPSTIRHDRIDDLASVVGGSEMDREAFQQDWGRWRSWGWGWGGGWGWGWNSHRFGWGFARPWAFGGWGWGVPAYGWGWGFQPAFGWGWGRPVGWCW